MGKEILKTDIKREKDKLYYCGTDKNGNIVVCETQKGKNKKNENS